MGPYLVSGEELARIMGVSTSTIQNWRANNCPVYQKGRKGQAYQYDTVEVIKWLIDRQCGGEKALDLNAERARLAHHQANKTALEEALLAGDVLLTDEVMTVWSNLISAAQKKLLAIPQKLGHRVIHAESVSEARQWLKDAIEEALNQLGRSGLPAKVERTLADRQQRVVGPASNDDHAVGG